VLKVLVKILVLKGTFVELTRNVDQKIMKPIVFAYQIILVMQKLRVKNREQLFANQTRVALMLCAAWIQIEQLDVIVHHFIQMEIQR
jgi:hypothetical protein